MKTKLVIGDFSRLLFYSMPNQTTKLADLLIFSSLSNSIYRAPRAALTKPQTLGDLKNKGVGSLKNGDTILSPFRD